MSALSSALMVSRDDRALRRDTDVGPHAARHYHRKHLVRVLYFIINIFIPFLKPFFHYTSIDASILQQRTTVFYDTQNSKGIFANIFTLELLDRITREMNYRVLFPLC